MSDQAISNPLGSKQQSAQHSSGPLWRNTFSTLFAFRHRKRAMRRNRPERGGRPIVWQCREQLSPAGVAGLAGHPQPSLATELSRRCALCTQQARLAALPGLPLRFWTILWTAMCTWMGIIFFQSFGTPGMVPCPR